MKLLLRFLYKKYRMFFYESFVEEFMGNIPKDLNEPAITFLANGKEVLEKWCMYHAYIIQRKALNDLPMANVYLGMLIYLKIILANVMKEKPSFSVNVGETEEEKVNTDNLISESIKNLKDYFSKPKEEQEKE